MTDTADTEHRTGGYDKKDVNVRVVLLVSAVIVVIVAGSLVWVDQWVTRMNEQAVYENMLKPENPLLLELRTREAAELGRYRVLDSTGQVYQIPIDRAMEVVIEQYTSSQAAPVSPAAAGQRNPR